MSIVGKWITLEILMLNEISQTEKEIRHVFSYMQNPDLKNNKDMNIKRGTTWRWEPVGSGRGKREWR
jgi:hypothetical protein